jgi:ABC-2 type transport system permease protein
MVVSPILVLAAALLGGQAEGPRLSAQSALVNKGELDFVLIKPMSSQFLVSTRYVTFSGLPAALVAAAYVLEAVRRLELRPSPFDLTAYVGLVLSGILSFYALWFMSVTLAVWAGRVNNIAFLIVPIMEMGRVPSDVFLGPFRVMFTFLIPIALVATIPSKALLGLLDPLTAVYAAGLTLALLVASSRFWSFSLRRYASASS